jgi:hypothetical protein
MSREKIHKIWGGFLKGYGGSLTKFRILAVKAKVFYKNIKPPISKIIQSNMGYDRTGINVHERISYV